MNADCGSDSCHGLLTSKAEDRRGAMNRPRRHEAATSDPATTAFVVREYDLAATLNSGQAFRWNPCGDAWVGVVGGRWVRLRQEGDRIEARTCGHAMNWHWLRCYLQLDVDLAAVCDSFPADPTMNLAVKTCRGLRLLRQDPWECLASFVLSSTKQIVQIRQIIGQLCQRFGKSIRVPPSFPAAHTFPAPAALAAQSEKALRACKMGFRAPYLLELARRVASGEIDLEGLRGMPVARARERLVDLPGVGTKIADCVLLFAYGFPEAFPVDVWVRRALVELYFPGRRLLPRDVRGFVEGYFGPNAGYAQQYLFHYMRGRAGRLAPALVSTLRA
jgi:N-glycosylase/DNA lyase